MNERLSGDYYLEKNHTEIKFTKSDFGFAIAMLVCGFLYWNLIRFDTLGAGVSLFAAVLCVLTVVYLQKSGIRPTKASLAYLGVVALSAVNFILFDNMELKGLNFLFLTLAFVYWIAVITGRRLEGRLSVSIIGDVVNQLLLVPFYNFGCGLLGIKERTGGNRRSKGVLNALLGILISIPVLFIVVSLLMNADAAFEHLMRSIRISISEDILEYFIQIVLGIPVASYLFGLIYGNLRNRHTGHITSSSFEKTSRALRFVPGITVYSALTLLNAVFLIFFLSQTSYLFSAFNDRLPEAMTYAQYARRGFFELCAVAGINLFVIGAAHMLTDRGGKSMRGEAGSAGGGEVGSEMADGRKFDSEPPRMLKIETITLCVFTLLLIATALSKMILYINYYGLTQLRVYTTWFMLMLAILFVIIILRQFRHFNGTKVAGISFIICFLLLCYANVDGMIAKYNIDRYLEGSLESVDVAALGQLSDAAVPHMYNLYEKTPDQGLKRSLKMHIVGEREEDVFQMARENTFRDFNVQAHKADRIRQQIIKD
ncbi:MAG: DUF4153 domain-containing protein [Anaerovoracaceae bacterium]|jgi:hypothetical protein